jgi:pimeloyl-ACP methyl ester carboxylesterase
MKLVFLHGLESSPAGHKPTLLRRTHDVVAPALPTQETYEFLMETRAQLPAHIAAKPLDVARRAVLEAKPEVVVGSSFGAGLAAMLAAEGTWNGPLVLCAPAAAKLFGVTALPQRPGRVVMLHGRRDEVVPCDDSVKLAGASQCEVLLWLVDDDHRLTASVDAGLLEAAIQWSARR